ncbi:MAG: hypothetical protein GY913_02305 [Proteobacteria bacterium]|nr:hypothetical protein [Pseudomonadota bacterium]MCP4915732.1 hypothetical protein [Pseudomonadota bacterium]
MNWILLLSAGCAPQDATIAGSFHTWLAASSSATVDEGDLNLKNADHFDCTTDVPEDRVEGALCPWIDDEVVNPNNEEATSPEYFTFLYGDDYFLKEGSLDAWRSEAIITYEGDFQLTFHHDLGNGQDYRVAMVFDPEFQPTECISEGATCYALDGEPTDDDGDGWVDGLDPDCMTGAFEVGYNLQYACNDGYDNDGDGNTDADDADCTSPWATENGSCSDSEDNDGDGMQDANDFDCVEHGDEDGATNDLYECSNGLDDDGDGDIDQDDSACGDNQDNDEGGYTDDDRCGDDIDNDEDGWVDGDDPDCDFFDTEAGWTPYACNDGVDNDGDTFVDADDADCWMPTRMTEEADDGTCVDGDDNDGDGWIDEEDPDCILGTAEDDTYFGTWACNDGLDNEDDGAGDGDMDAEDSHCKSAMQGTEESGTSNNCEAAGDEDGDGWENELDPDCLLSNKEKGYLGFACNDGVDNDGDTFVDADDVDCLSPWRASEEEIDAGTDCTNGTDDDGDGWVDADDGGCLLGDFEADVTTVCSDGADNEDTVDGLIDADDTDCVWSLDEIEEADDLCADGYDNDGDGWTDAFDPDCATDGYEVGFSTAACNDGLDNDLDGNIDVDDDGCSSGGDILETVDNQCGDNLDNDEDGWLDLDDPDCAILGDGVEANQIFGLTECNDGTDNDGDGATDAVDSDCDSAVDTAEAKPEAGDPIAVELDQANVLDKWSEDEDGATIYYLNAGANQQNPVKPDDPEYWYLPQEWFSGYAHSKFAAEEFDIFAPDFEYLWQDSQDPDADAYEAAVQEVRDAAFGWQAEPHVFNGSDWDGYEIKVEGNEWRVVDQVEAGLDNWAEVHHNFVRINDGSNLEVGGKATGDFQLFMSGYEAGSYMIVRGTFEVPEIQEEKWGYDSLEDDLREQNNTPVCE